VNTKANRPAFTIVELITVIAILTLLISILLPTLSASRRQAKTNVCLSNLKGLGTAFTVYLTENRDQFPPMRMKYWRPKDVTERPDNKYINEYNCREPRWQWFLQLDSGPVINPPARLRNKPGGFGDDGMGMGSDDHSGRTMTNDVFRCPALDDPEYERDIRNGAYGYNYQYLGNSRQDTNPDRWDNFSVGLHQVKAPGGTVLLADSRGGGSRRHGVHSYTLDPPRRAYERNAVKFGPSSQDAEKAGLDPDPLLAFSPVSPRHNNQGNVIFADAHGQAMTPKELGYELRPEDKMPIPIHDAAAGKEWTNKLWTGTGQDPEVAKRPAAPPPD
jgi:prepilin-type processing-associated H-X9-DG protein